jgi:hypothetical protein|tara:strand:+ start:3445 stop:4212 length:768 start_codon:yes stop_codon:yes gene_type:complete
MEPTKAQAQSELNMGVPYDVIELPSQGRFYHSKKSNIKVTYLTASDENVLMSQNLVQSGDMVDVLLRRKILEPDVNIDELLECDKEAVLIFLRNTAYGPTYKITLIDPEDKKSFEHTVDLSSVSTKDFALTPDKNGEFDFSLPVSKKTIKFKFLTGLEEKELEAVTKEYDGLQVAPVVTKRLEKHITEIDGEKDKGVIAQRIQSMPIRDSQELRKYIATHKPGLDLDLTVNAPSGNQVSTRLSFGVAFFRPFFGI